jgi:hypothetical protein
MAAVSAYETSVNFYQTTWRNIPEDSHLLSPFVWFLPVRTEPTFHPSIYNPDGSSKETIGTENNFNVD